MPELYDDFPGLPGYRKRIRVILQEIRNNTNLIKKRWSKEKNNTQLIKMTNIFLNHTSSFYDSEEYMLDEIKTIKIMTVRRFQRTK